jgi:hypothetical protein
MTDNSKERSTTVLGLSALSLFIVPLLYILAALIEESFFATRHMYRLGEAIGIAEPLVELTN